VRGPHRGVVYASRMAPSRRTLWLLWAVWALVLLGLVVFVSLAAGGRVPAVP
jgi:hypothetical protein